MKAASRPPDHYLRFPDSRPCTCREAHEFGYCFGWCHLPDEFMPPIPLWDVPAVLFDKSEFKVKPMEIPAGLLLYLDYRAP